MSKIPYTSFQRAQCFVNLTGFGVSYQPPYKTGNTSLSACRRQPNAKQADWPSYQYGQWNLQKPPNSLQLKGNISPFQIIAVWGAASQNTSYHPSLQYSPGKSLLSTRCWILFSYLFPSYIQRSTLSPFYRSNFYLDSFLYFRLLSLLIAL